MEERLMWEIVAR